MKARRLTPAGQDLVEYAIIVPIFLAILLVIVDLGRYTFIYSSVQNAAREGARAGIVPDTDAAGDLFINTVRARQTAIDRAIGLDPVGIISVTAVTLDDPLPIYAGGQPELIRVNFTYRFDPLTPFIGSLLPGGNLQITRSSTMRLEW